MKKINFVIVGILLIILIINVKVSANNSLNNVIDSNIINNISNETVDSKNSLDQSNANSNIELKSSNSNVESIETKSIEEGVYRIATSTNSNIVVDISGASKDNQANANLWEYKGEIQQKFKLEYDGNGAYVFRNLNSNKVLDVEWGGMTPGTNVWQYEYNGSDSQKWIINENSDGSVNIVSKLNGLALDFQDGKASNGINVRVYTKNNSQAQKFKLIKIDQPTPAKTIANGRYRIAFYSNKYIGLDVAGASKNNQANVQLWHYEGVDQQLFDLTCDSSGYYKIKNVNSGKVLDVEWGGINAGTNVWQYEDNGTDSQKWIITKTSDGYYNIVSKLNGLYLDVTDGKTSNGTNVRLYGQNGAYAQKFQILTMQEPAGEKTLDNGTYRIATALNTNSVVDVSGASKNNQANINLWQYKGEIQQKFKLEYDGKGYYTIKNVNSGKVLDVEWGSLALGANVWQYEDNGTDSQKWVIKKTNDGYYNIISKLSGYYLDISNGSPANGTNVQVYEENGTTSQKFKLINKDTPKGSKTLAEGTYRIALASNTNAGLDVSNSNRNNGANVQVWNYDNVLQQQFNLSYDGNGYYTIIAVHSGKVLDIQNGGNVNSTNVWQYTNNGSDAQKWVIKANDDGTYNVISKVESMYLDIADGKTNNGNNIRIYEGNGSSAQKFKFIKITDKSEKSVEEDNYRIAMGYKNNVGLDISNGSTQNQANVQIWQYTDAQQQKFVLEYTDEGYYKIKNAKSLKVLDVEWGGMTSGTNVWQYEDNDTDSQKWIIRQTSDGHYNVISKLNGLYLDVVNGKTQNGTNVQVCTKNNQNPQKFDFIKVNIGLNIDSSKYPGVQEKVNEIVKNHPNWVFQPVYLNLDFNTAVEAEYADKEKNTVDTTVYKGEWIRENPYSSGEWYSASRKAIAYMMDIRNFLDDVNVFQFQYLNDYLNGVATLEGIQDQVNGTFLNNYANDINTACRNQNVNPYYVIARLFQEQGKKGTTIGTGMDGGDGKTYYNPFNIGAQLGNDYNTALDTAKKYGWDSMEKAIQGGIDFLKANWLENAQNTLYLNKFDVDASNGTPLYTHQYMQNLTAAYSEARTLRGCYVDTNKLDTPFVFYIPLYENMPTEVSPRPSNNSNEGGMSAQVVDITSNLQIREQPNTTSKVLGHLYNGETVISVERAINGNWNKIVTDKQGSDGYNIVGYVSGKYLNFIKDKTNVNYRATVKTSDGIGVNVRYGPSTDFGKAGALEDGVHVTVISHGVYHTISDDKKYDFWWDWCILDDGRKVFIPTNYLVR